jgi:hypothetical protein
MEDTELRELSGQTNVGKRGGVLLCHETSVKHLKTLRIQHNFGHALLAISPASHDETQDMNEAE